jgi:hypothetical protein
MLGGVLSPTGCDSGLAFDVLQAVDLDQKVELATKTIGGHERFNPR